MEVDVEQGKMYQTTVKGIKNFVIYEYMGSLSYVHHKMNMKIHKNCIAGIQGLKVGSLSWMDHRKADAYK